MVWGVGSEGYKNHAAGRPSLPVRSLACKFRVFGFRVQGHKLSSVA